VSTVSYSNYKEIGHDWIGCIPSHWHIRRLKYALKLKTEKTESRTNPVALENIEGWSGRYLQTDTEYAGEGVAFEVDDLLFGKLRPYLAKVWSAESEGQAVGDFHVLRPAALTQSDYAKYQMLNRNFISIVNSSTYGAKMPRVGWDFMGNLPFILPPLAEQTAIATFLDRETAKIDALVNEQQRLIELLKEKRQAVISHAVTKGLDPNVKLKSSGVEWPLAIPAHWEILPLTRLIKKFVDYRGVTPEKIDSGIPLITASQIKNGCINHDLDPVFISEEEYNSRMNRGFPEVGDVLLTTEAPLGEVAMIEDAYVSPGQRMILMKTHAERITNQFLFSHFRSDFGRNELFKGSSGSTASGIRADRLRASSVLVPPIEEQDQIVRYIDMQTKDFDLILADIQIQLDLLKERRSTLISAAVTGKIDVHGLVQEQHITAE